MISYTTLKQFPTEPEVNFQTSLEQQHEFVINFDAKGKSDNYIAFLRTGIPE